jgi:hypothetical protein
MLNTYIRLVCKTYPWSDASTIRQKYLRLKLLFKRCSTCFGQHFAPHQEHFWTAAAASDSRTEAKVDVFLAVARKTSTLASIREPEAAAAVQKCFWWWAKFCPKHVEQRLNNKRFYDWVCFWLVILFEDLKMHGTTNHKPYPSVRVYITAFLVVFIMASCRTI